MKISGLSEGLEYEFCVIAENVAGLSEPSQPSVPAISQDPKCNH